MLKPTFLRLTSLPTVTNRGHARRQGRVIAETLEVRILLSATSWLGLVDPIVEVEANDTLDAAQDVGHVSFGQQVAGPVLLGQQTVGTDSLGQTIGIVGAIGSGTGRSSDVDWFQFTVSDLSRVQISSLADALGAEHSVIVSLYGLQLAELDPSTPLSHVLFGRQDLDSRSPLSAVLPAGTYFVAVSGAGNQFFHPFLANSGVAGTATEYGVRLRSLPVAQNTDPTSALTLPAEPARDGDDTSATATDLGNLTGTRHLQVAGAIGDDPFYRAASANPFAQNLAADVDMYHVQVTGEGRFALTVEAFAGRIGSPLDPALTLFRTDEFGALQFVATNNDTLNATESTNGQFPLFTDAALFAGLTAGDYFLAVSSSGNDPASGPDGVFDPQVAHSGLNGGSTGAYVLDVSLTPDNQPPTVVSATPAAGSVLNAPPTHLDLQFSEPVNVTQLALSAYQTVGIDTVSAVFLVDANGTRYFPRLQSYDSATSTARFLMLDGLPNGPIELHVSGAEGLTDFAGLPIQGNQPDGDFVTRFVVAGPARGSNGQPTRWLNQAANDSIDVAQNLGVLFPHELQSRVNIVRDATTDAGQPADIADLFRFEVLQSRMYFFTLLNTPDVGNLQVEVLREDGSSAGLISVAGGILQLGFLPAGQYLARVTGWDATQSADASYRLEIQLGGAGENPTPLTTGAAPAISIQLVGGGPVGDVPPAVQFTRTPAVVVAATNNNSVTPLVGSGTVSELPSAVQFASTTAAVSNSSDSVIPSGLMAGLNAPALGSQTFGGQGITAPAPARDTAIVRLFGFSERLFTLIDSSQPRMSNSLTVTQVELTDSELLDLLDQSRTAAEVESTAAESAETESSETETESEAEASELRARNPEDSQPTTLNARPADKMRSSTSGTRRGRPRGANRPEDNQQSSTSGSATTFALASALAVTLRDRSRREPDSNDRRRPIVDVRSLNPHDWN